jgi:hypothetical protein
VDYEPDSGPQTLLEVNLLAERRFLMDGDDGFPHSYAIGRIVWLGGGSVQADDLSPDSRTTFGLPSPVVNDERLPMVTVEVLIGYHAVVMVSSDGPVSKAALRTLADRSARELLESVSFDEADRTKDLGFRNASRVADGIRYVATANLRDRIAEVEESVRDALSDEQVTREDYTALRVYPDLLAMVEEQAQAVKYANWESLVPASAHLFRTPVADMFFSHADGVEKKARQAVATLSGLVSSQQVVIVQRQRLEVERLQRIVTLVGATVLVPGLVAATFGANVNVPGEGTDAGFWAMISLMAASGLGSYAVLRSIEAGQLATVLDRLRVPERIVTGGLGVLAAVLFAAGIVLIVLKG